MAIPVRCEHCQAEYVLDDRLAGKLARCQACGRKFRIPGAISPGDSQGTTWTDMPAFSTPPQAQTRAGGTTRMPAPPIEPIGANALDEQLEQAPEAAFHYSLTRKRLEGPIGDLIYVWLPRMLVAFSLLGIGVGITLLALNQFRGRPGLVWGTIFISLVVYLFLTIPMCMLAVRIAERKYHFQLPAVTRGRLTAIMLLPVAFAFLLTGYGNLWVGLAAIPLGLFAAFFAFWLLLHLNYNNALRAFIGASLAFTFTAGVNIALVWVMIVVVNQIAQRSN